MNKVLERNQQVVAKTDARFDSRSQIQQELRQRIQAILQVCQTLPADSCLEEIRHRLCAIQADCKTIQKAFIVVEMHIDCAQYNLGGCQQDGATLFRGPSEDASVAICLTSKGSLLHRNGEVWRVYRNAGDVDPVALGVS